ncbi:MAG: signal peptidase II, partial [Candidatus Omnitrophota bacterium]
MVFIILSIILSLDQLTKILANKNLLLNKSVPLINNVFHLTLVYNRGAAFGLLKNQLHLFIFTSVIAVVLIYLNLKDAENKRHSIALSLILAGALGNLIDRLFFGYVIDFLDFRIWPVFNIADSAITIGMILLGWV